MNSSIVQLDSDPSLEDNDLRDGAGLAMTVCYEEGKMG